VSERRPTLLSRLVKAFLLALYRWKGWTIEGQAPAGKKCVILGAPHTSNWDFVFFLGTVTKLGLKPSFMGKLSLFRRPLTRFMYDMGGIPVDRRAKDQNYVEQVVAAFAKADKLALVIAPEGTRGPIKGWRSGFYHIALGAGVPIVPAWVDNETMKGGIGQEIMPCGDYEADLRKIAEFYYSVMPRHPKLAVLYAETGILGETDHA
jgi:1-acyl-sn-glycerol-3-phosphate acyltransferase